MFVINPDPYSLPCYRIGPFQTHDLSVNHCLPESNKIDDYFGERFFEKEYTYTENGRKAINLALQALNLQKEDVVTILTTTGNFYISGCVTNEIENFCNWSREIVPETKALFVNHEFGYPYHNLGELKKYNMPIIEDCAGSFFSEDKNHETGQVGDFVIYSFPKMFPLQIGGLLVCNTPGKYRLKHQIDTVALRHVKNVLSFHIGNRENIINQRLSNYQCLSEKFDSLGFSERFQLEMGTIPGVFMFKNDESLLNLPELKKYFYAHGIQCSVFYGEEAFFIPVHQALSEQDLEYFREVIQSFMLKR